MPTRTRARARKPDTDTAQQEIFNPGKAVTSTEANPTGEFYDSQAGDYAEGDEVRTVDEEDAEGDDADEGADDPTAGKPLGTTTTGMTQGQQAAAAELRNYLERLERLADEAKTIQTDIKEVLGEAKGRGYDTKAIKDILKLRATDEGKLRERLNILRTYAHALGIDEDLV